MSVARHLINRLFEVQTINAKEGEAKVKALAARIVDPRARLWFTTAALHFYNNIEQLNRPYKAKAVSPQRVSGVGRENPVVPHADMPPEATRLGPQAQAMLTSRAGLHWPSPSPADADVVDIGTKNAGAPDQRTVWVPRKKAILTTQDRINYALHQYDQEERAAGRLPESRAQRLAAFLLEAGEPYETSLHQPAWSAMVDTGKTLDQALAGLQQANKAFKYRLVAGADQPSIETNNPGMLLSREGQDALAAAGFIIDTERMAEQGQTGAKSVPVQQVQREFNVYNPDKAPKAARARVGGPMPVANWPGVGAPEWAGQATGQLHQFQPSRADERLFWQRLNALVRYFNLLHDELIFKDSVNSLERDRAKAAEAVLSQLTTKKRGELVAVNPRDAALFLNLLADAEAHIAAVPDLSQSLRARNEMTLIAQSGPLKLYRINDVKAAQRLAGSQSRWVSPAVAARAGNYGETGQTVRWCIKQDSYRDAYFRGGGTYYIILKNGDAYVMTQPGSPTTDTGYKTCQHVDNLPASMTPEVVNEIAPLLARSPIGHLYNGVGGDEPFKRVSAAVQEIRERD